MPYIRQVFDNFLTHQQMGEGGNKETPDESLTSTIKVSFDLNHLSSVCQV